MPRAHREDGAVLAAKDNTTRAQDYPDVHTSSHAQLLSLSVETYGRWGSDSLRLVQELASFKAHHVPDVIAPSLRQSCARRWWGFLSCAVQRSVAHSNLNERGHDLCDAEYGVVACVDEILDFHR